MARKRYSREFKDEAVKLVGSGTPVREAANDLGISEFTLRDWVKKAQPQDGERVAPSESDELHRLRAENKRLRMEREILKKATAFFAKDQ